MVHNYDHLKSLEVKFDHKFFRQRMNYTLARQSLSTLGDSEYTLEMYWGFIGNVLIGDEFGIHW